MVVAEYDRRASRYENAMAAYDRGIAHFEKSIRDNPPTLGTAVHFQALALGGKARVAFHANKFDEALQFVLASFQKSPDSAASLDGLNLSTVDTAKLLLAKLRQAEDRESVDRLDSALKSLPPSMLLPAEFDRPQRAQPPADGAPGKAPHRGGRGGRGRGQKNGGGQPSETPESPAAPVRPASPIR
jgi:tetratricopeptide (TPR) repeat protein